MRGRLVTLIACGACGRVGFDELAPGGTGLPLVLEPPQATINLGSPQQLVASGGAEPYTFTATGGGWVDASGRFVSPNRQGASTVTVTDALGDEASTQITYRGALLFAAGGETQTTLALNPEVRSSTDGVSWTTIGGLPMGIATGTLLVFDNRLLYIGGRTVAGPSDRVFASSDGTVWMQIGMLPAAAQSSPATVHQGALWVVSGITNAPTDLMGVYRSVDGATWTQVGTFPSPRHYHSLVSTGDRLVVMGGHESSGPLVDDTYESTDGMTWTMTPARLTLMADFTSTTQLGTRTIRMCGTGCGGVGVSDDLASWMIQTLPGGSRYGAGLIAWNGVVYMFGGNGPPFTSTDGLAWSAATATFPQNLGLTTAAQFTPP